MKQTGFQILNNKLTVTTNYQNLGTSFGYMFLLKHIENLKLKILFTAVYFLAKILRYEI